MREREHLDVLVIGTVSVDIVLGGISHWPLPGAEIGGNNFAISCGSIFNTAATLSRLGLRVGLLTKLNNDFLGRFILEEFDRFGIARDLVIIDDTPTRAVSICLAHEGERGIVYYEDIPDATLSYLLDVLSTHRSLKSAQKTSADNLPPPLQQLLSKYDFGAVFMSAQARSAPLLDALAGYDVPFFLDPGGEIPNLEDEKLLDVIKQAKVIALNLREAQYITKMATADEAVRQLATWTEIAVVKIGAQGAIACQAGEITYCPAYPIENVIDTTGAGDAFNGGFIYGYLNGYSLDNTLRCGTICGGLSTTAPGGTATVPTMEELEYHLQNVRGAPAGSPL